MKKTKKNYLIKEFLKRDNFGEYCVSDAEHIIQFFQKFIDKDKVPELNTKKLHQWLEDN